MVDNTVDLYAAKPDIRPESRFLPTQPAFDAPFREGGSRRNIATPFGMEKLHHGVATRRLKNFDDMFIRFDTTHERDRHTDRHRMTA